MKAHRTRSQEQISRLLKSLKRPISAQDLFLELRQRQQNLGLATVYRALESLKLRGEVQVRKLATGESVYSLIQRDEHHLTCVNCGESIAFAECPVHDLEERLETSHKFKIYYHTLEFFGLCRLCRHAT
jgi:Fur family ferric uptake transcriptional regulator